MDWPRDKGLRLPDDFRPDAHTILLVRGLESVTELVKFATFYLVENDLSPFEVGFKLDEIPLSSLRYANAKQMFKALAAKLSREGKTMNPAKIWIEQREAARGIEADFGTPNALSYLIGKKFLNFDWPNRSPFRHRPDKITAWPGGRFLTEGSQSLGIHL